MPPADSSKLTLPADRPAGTSLIVIILVMVALITPMIALSQVIAYWRTDVVDDQMFGYFGWRIAHGATVYVDVWDNKPPGIYWINAVGFLVGNDTYFGVIAMCVLALITAHTGFFVVGASVYHRGASALATILLSFYVTHAFYTGGTNRTETFLVACELVGVAFYMRGFARDRWWKWYAAGICCGLAFLFKQVGLAAWGCMGLHLIILVSMRELPVMVGLRRCLLLLGGLCTTIGLAAAYLASQGALYEAYYASFLFNRYYFDVNKSQFPYNFVTWKLLEAHVRQVLLMPLLMATAATIHAFLWWLRPADRPSDIQDQLQAQRPVCPHYFLFFMLWFLVASYGALLSPMGYRHYLVPVVPPLLLMGGYLINVLRAEAKLVRRFQQRAWVTVAFVIIGYFAHEAVVFQFEQVSHVWISRIDPWYFDEGEYEPAHWEVVGDAVMRHSGPDDRIQVWGYMPGVYLHARRINTCRFTTTEKPGHVGASANFILTELEQTMRADPPAIIAMQDQGYRWLHGRIEGSASFNTTLAPWIDENYTMVEEIPEFETVYIFKRNDLMIDD